MLYHLFTHVLAYARNEHCANEKGPSAMSSKNVDHKNIKNIAQQCWANTEIAEELSKLQCIWIFLGLHCDSISFIRITIFYVIVEIS